jgi:hypothetical protein
MGKKHHIELRWEIPILFWKTIWIIFCQGWAIKLQNQVHRFCFQFCGFKTLVKFPNLWEILFKFTLKKQKSPFFPISFVTNWQNFTHKTLHEYVVKNINLFEIKNYPFLFCLQNYISLTQFIFILHNNCQPKHLIDDLLMSM